MIGVQQNRAVGIGAEPLHLLYIKEFHRREGNTWLSKCSKCCRTFSKLCSLVMGAYVCNEDLCANPDDSEDEADGERKVTRLQRLTSWIPKPIRRSTWRRQLRCSWFSWALFALYLVLTCYLCLDVTYLYKYEINRLRLVRVRDLIETHGPARLVAIERNPVALSVPLASNSTMNHSKLLMSLSEFERILQVRVDKLRLALTYLGDKFIKWGLVNSCLYVTVILQSFALYLLIMWMFQYAQRHDYQFERDYFDGAKEERRVDVRCEREVRKYLESNRMYEKILVENNGLVNANLRAQTSIPTGGSGGGDKSASIYFNTPHFLKQMLHRGALRPLNRSKLRMHRRDITYAFLHSMSIFWCIIFDASALYFLYKRSAGGLDLGELSMLTIQFINTCGVAYHLATAIMACLEQTQLVHHVLSVIRECTRRNEREFLLYISAMHVFAATQRVSASEVVGVNNGELLAESRGTEICNKRHKRRWQANTSWATIAERVNSNYLFTLMTYKIFVAQFSSFRRTHRGFLPACFSVVFIIPTLSRIHVPYLEHETGFRLAAIYICLTMLLPLNFLCVPMCHLHTRCQELSPALASLMAHIARARDSGLRIYDEHAEAVLVKELSKPKKMLEQFTIQSVILDGTYAGLVKIYFWWGLIVLSILLNFRGNDQDQLFGSYSQDPLGVWCFQLA